MPEVAVVIWGAVCFVLTGLMGVVGYFLKRTMDTTDGNTKDINLLQQTSVTKNEVKHHERDINHIKQTYVTKDEMKEMRTELKAEIEKISKTVTDIQNTTLPKEDFYRSAMETNRKLETLQQTILERLGG